MEKNSKIILEEKLASSQKLFYPMNNKSVKPISAIKYVDKNNLNDKSDVHKNNFQA